jgi:hypothetical protein
MIAGCPKRLENFKQFPVIPKNQYNKMFKPLLLCHCFFFISLDYGEKIQEPLISDNSINIDNFYGFSPIFRGKNM